MTFNILTREPVWGAVRVDGSRTSHTLLDLLICSDTVRTIDEAPEVALAAIRYGMTIIARSLWQTGVLPADTPDTSEGYEELALTHVPEISHRDLVQSIIAYADAHDSWFDLDSPAGLGQVPGVVPSSPAIVKGTDNRRHTLFPMLQQDTASPTDLSKANAAKRMLTLGLLAAGGNSAIPEVKGVTRPASKLFKVKNGAPRDDKYPLGRGTLFTSPMSYAVGSTLSETLRYGLTPELFKDARHTAPVWELDSPTKTPWGNSAGDRMTGPVNVMTLPIRHIWLDVRGDRLHNAVTFPGEGLPTCFVENHDPMVSMRRVETSNAVPDIDEYGFPVYTGMPPSYGAAPLRTWNILSSLLPVFDADAVTSKSVHFATRLRREHRDNRPLSVAVVSARFSSDATRKLRGVDLDTFTIPSFIAGTPKTYTGRRACAAYVQEIRAEIGKIGSAAWKLRHAVSEVESQGSKKSPLRAQEFHDLFLRTLEPKFAEWIASITPVEWDDAEDENVAVGRAQSSFDDARDLWRQTVKREALAVFNAYTAMLSTRTWLDRRVNYRYAVLNKSLNTLFSDPAPDTADSPSKGTES